MRRTIASLSLGLAGLWASHALPAETSDPWQRFLDEHVVETERDGIPLNAVDYVNLAAGSPDLQRTLARFARADLGSLSEVEQKTLFINAYNALAIQMVLDHWPISSIKDAGGVLFGKVWDKDAGTVAGKTMTLGEIEHEILRKLGDPRIHAAIVCASVSCPDLRREAYVAERLDEQLDDQMRAFLANDRKGYRLDREKGTVTLSPIFDWFEEDFEATAGHVVDYVLPFLPSDDASWIRQHREGLRVEYFDYDWRLNATP